MTDFEKLGLLYLGRQQDPATGASQSGPLLYDSRDLLTHALVVGMTGSGKTGLGIVLMEEAAIDGVPVIAIDPKGDLGNLLLTFPSLSASAFRPWIDEDDARRAGTTAEAFAAQQASLWSAGLASWGQDGDRIERLRRAAAFDIFTPGSRAGRQVSILSSFAAPGGREDDESVAERAAGTATSALALAGVDAPPRSREHNLVASILGHAWQRGEGLDLASLVRQIQTPPFDTFGVVDLEAFCPAKERFALAMRLNGVLAAPGFESWMEGEPLDPQGLLYTAEGRPRVAIFSIAHLGDAERMFFVSLLLNQVIGWIRRQPGTTSLRAILYMDEIVGYFPPVANPPSKGPLLTLLKQARAHGLGVILATQNPVDLDYKGLANIGTWFLGRLQTERDKARVLDGLVAAGGFEPSEAGRLLSGLKKRVFLMHNVHERRPVLFESRWTLSYLRGPLSRDQIRALQAAQAAPARTPDVVPFGAPGPRVAAATAATAPAVAGRASGTDGPRAGRGPSGEAAGRPLVPPGIREVFVPATTAGPVVYRPWILGAARVRLADRSLDVDEMRDVVYLAPVTDGAVPLDWAGATRADLPAADVEATAASAEARYRPLPAAAAQPRRYGEWAKSFGRWVAQQERLELFRHPGLRLTSRPGESERDFRIRVQLAARDARDAAIDAVRKKYAPKQAALAERLRRAESAIAREQQEAAGQKAQTAISIGATVLGALFARRAATAGTIGRATTAARGVGRSMKETADVERAEATAEAARAAVARLEDDVAADVAAISSRHEQEAPFEVVAIAPKRGDVEVQYVALAWVPEATAS